MAGVQGGRKGATACSVVSQEPGQESFLYPRFVEELLLNFKFGNDRIRFAFLRDPSGRRRRRLEER